MSWKSTNRAYATGMLKMGVVITLAFAALLNVTGIRPAQATAPVTYPTMGHMTLVTVTATAITNGTLSPSGITVCNMETIASGNVYYWGYSSAVTDSIGMPIFPQSCIPIPTGYPQSSATMVIYIYSPAAAPATNGVRFAEGS